MSKSSNEEPNDSTIVENTSDVNKTDNNLANGHQSENDGFEVHGTTDNESETTLDEDEKRPEMEGWNTALLNKKKKIHQRGTGPLSETQRVNELKPEETPLSDDDDDDF